MPELTLTDLVRNGTMSPAIAATIATAAAERRSLLVFAIPRLAGKTTTLRAALAYAPAGTAVHDLSEAHGADLGIPEPPDGGYLFVSEIAETPFPDYLWGEPVRRVFTALGSGFSLATALHAPGIDEAFSQICHGNGVSDAEAARIDLAVYIRSLGPDWREPTARRVAAVHEIQGVTDGVPQTRYLYSWDDRNDGFETVEAPMRIGTAGGEFDRLLAEFSAAAPAPNA
ncbi:MAG: hypothetical protein O3B31_05470 [Chloroflexi bacterium]|nr:hypothetical protein [Chloroflexota bacterium]MDA1002783.1 hypothetical protein [Chloroflexota bacterium]